MIDSWCSKAETRFLRLSERIFGPGQSNGLRSPEECDSVCWHPAELALVYAVLHLAQCGCRNKSKSAMYSLNMPVAKTGPGRGRHCGEFRRYGIYGHRYLMRRHHSRTDHLIYFSIASPSRNMFRTLPLLRTARTALRQTAPVALRPQPLALTLRPLAARGYAAAAGLSKDDITVRILDVLKSFEKVDSSKVRGDAFSDRLAGGQGGVEGLW